MAPRRARAAKQKKASRQVRNDEISKTTLPSDKQMLSNLNSAAIFRRRRSPFPIRAQLNDRQRSQLKKDVRCRFRAVPGIWGKFNIYGAVPEECVARRCGL